MKNGYISLVRNPNLSLAVQPDRNSNPRLHIILSQTATYKAGETVTGISYFDLPKVSRQAAKQNGLDIKLMDRGGAWVGSGLLVPVSPNLRSPSFRWY
jgi:hypothetical protein